MEAALEVLLVDDSPADVRTVRELLAEAGPAVSRLETADTLAAAVDLIRGRHFDAVLLGLRPRGGSSLESLETLEHLKRSAPNVPIVVLTAEASADLPLETMRAGAQDYLVKGSFDGRLLLKSIRYGIERARSLRALRESEQRYRRVAEQLSYEASHDALTGLYNRRAFESRIKRVLQRVGKRPERYALCYVDLDQFKIINETCGHVAGDELLKHLAGALERTLRGGDVLARLGGDEFGLLLRIDDADEAHANAKRLLAAIQAFRFEWGASQLEVDASVGLVMLEDAARDTAEVMSAADTACYTAKDKGGGRVYVGRPGGETLARRIGEMQWVMRIREAVKENRLVLFQQPIASVHAGGGGIGGLGDGDGGLGLHDGTKHFELLVRSVDSRGKLHGPNLFLPAVERYNMAPMVDRWVVNAALEWLAANGADLGAYRCSINLSGQSVGEPRFLEFLERRLDAVGVAGECLCFEITESAAIRNLGAARALMDALKKRGVRFSLDDFGSGLSSFAYLRNLNVDYVKLDGVFIKSIASDAVNRATVKSIAEIVHAMGKETIAEFVEDPGTIPLLRALGVDYVQGYGVGAPAPIERLLESEAAV